MACSEGIQNAGHDLFTLLIFTVYYSLFPYLVLVFSAGFTLELFSAYIIQDEWFWYWNFTYLSSIYIIQEEYTVRMNNFTLARWRNKQKNKQYPCYYTFTCMKHLSPFLIPSCAWKELGNWALWLSLIVEEESQEQERNVGEWVNASLRIMYIFFIK